MYKLRRVPVQVVRYSCTLSATPLHNLCRAFAHFVQPICTLCATHLHKSLTTGHVTNITVGLQILQIRLNERKRMGKAHPLPPTAKVNSQWGQFFFVKT